MGNRQSIRLPEYDYSHTGLYFLTFCTHHHLHLFGEIINGEMKLNEFGGIVKDEWEMSEKIRDEIKLHEYVIMPNHFHAIVEIVPVGANGRSPVHCDMPVYCDTPQMCKMPKMQSKSIGSLIAGYKSSVTTKINIISKAPGKKLWQRNYWEHIVRNSNELIRIREYIINNPKTWNNDKLNGGKGNTIMEQQEVYGNNIESWML